MSAIALFSFLFSFFSRYSCLSMGCLREQQQTGPSSVEFSSLLCSFSRLYLVLHNSR